MSKDSRAKYLMIIMRNLTKSLTIILQLAYRNKTAHILNIYRNTLLKYCRFFTPTARQGYETS